MKKHRQLLALFICLVMSVSLLTGYSETKAATEEPTQSAEQDATQETAETREITDMAGRKVTVPTAENIESVFSADRKSTRLNSSHDRQSRMPSSA